MRRDYKIIKLFQFINIKLKLYCRGMGFTDCWLHSIYELESIKNSRKIAEEARKHFYVSYKI